ncbi:TPA: hypothetical protein N2D99_002019 [Clostridium botulinum]|nr:hypothetical protein [Clostridium botulinum]
MKYLEYLNSTNDFFKLKINALLQSDCVYIIVCTSNSLEMITEKSENKTFIKAITNDKKVMALYEEEIKNEKIKLMRISIDRLIDFVIPELQRKKIDGIKINDKSLVGLIISTSPKDLIIYKIIRNNLKNKGGNKYD